MSGTIIGDGTFQGLSISVLTAIVLGILTHVALTRSRLGWHVLAVGGSGAPPTMPASACGAPCS